MIRMVSKRTKGLLAAEAAVCLALSAPLAEAGGGAAAMAFPFAPLGRLLRLMSEAGAFGDVCAWALYALISLLPLGYFLWRARKKGLGIQDGLLLLMSGLLFFQLYYMVNPGLLPRVLGMAASAFGGAAMGCVFYALLAAYLVLRFIRTSMAAEPAGLIRCCKILQAALAAALVFGAFALAPASLVSAIREVRAGNQGNTGLGMTYFFLVLGCGVRMSAYLLDLWVLEAVVWLLEVWRREPWSEESVHTSGFLARRSALALMATVLINLGYQLLQLLFMADLYKTDMTASLPLGSLALVLAALMLAQFLREGKRLKDDNDLFI